MTRFMYGIRNVVFFNVRAEGDDVWFYTRSERDAALEALRNDAISRGLAPGAARAGIWAIRRHVASAVGQAWLDEMEDGRMRPGVRLERVRRKG